MPNTQELDYTKVQSNIDKIQQALEESDMGQVSTHLLVLQKQLQATPHLVDMLLPEDIGVLVTAERKRMTEDILLQSMPKVRKGAGTRKKKPQAVLNLSGLAKLDLGDW